MFLKYYQVQASIAGASVHAALFTRPSLVDTTHIPELADAVRPLSPLMIGHGKGILFQWIAGSVFSMQQYVRWRARFTVEYSCIMLPPMPSVMRASDSRNAMYHHKTLVVCNDSFISQREAVL